MWGMFWKADSFDQDISDWYIPDANTKNMFNESYNPNHTKPSAALSKRRISTELIGDEYVGRFMSEYLGGKKKRTRKRNTRKYGSKTKSKGTQKSKSASKEKRVGKGLINTRNEDCGINGSTGCCPHMGPDEKGRYRATNEKTTLTYDNKKYELHTCCIMCSEAMNALARTDPAKFKASYVSRYMPNGNMVAKNQHTKKEVQVLKLKK
jgi:hypothetical protein